MEQKKYKVEEYHRGEWIPLEGKDEKGEKTGQKIVKITEETAEIMNIDSQKTRIRYVLDQNSKKSNPYVLDGPDFYKMSKAEQEEVAQGFGVSFTEEHTNQTKRADFLKSVLENGIN